MGSGGRREGAGRKPNGYVPVTFRLPKDDVRIISETSRELGITKGAVVHEMVTEYVKNAEK